MDGVSQPTSQEPPRTRARLRPRLRLSRTARSGFLSLADQAVVSGVNFLTTVLIGRACGPDELGIYSLGFSIVILISGVQLSLVSVPYTIYGSRMSERDRALYAGSVLGHSVALAVLSIICLSLSAAVLSLGIGPPGLASVLWVLAGMTPFLLLREFMRRFAFAHMRMATALVLDVVIAAMQIGGLAFLVATGNLSAATGYVVAGTACAAAGLLTLAALRGNFAVRVDRIGPSLRRNWSLGRWIFASQMAAVPYGYSLYWLLALVLGAQSTGVFAACMTIVMLAKPFVMGVGNLLEPLAANAFTEAGPDHLRRVVWTTTVLLGSAIGLFCLLVIVFGEQLLVLLYEGSQYADRGAVLATLALTELATALSIGAEHGLRVIERPEMNFWSTILAAVITLTIAAALIQYWGILGAAISMLIGTVAGSIAHCTAFFWLVDQLPRRHEDPVLSATL